MAAPQSRRPYLRENRVVGEEWTQLAPLLLTPGVESSKAGTLVSSLVAFKRLHDDNILLEDAMPEFVAKRPARYRGKRLKDLCGEMHAFFRESGVSQLQMAQFAAKHLPEVAMTPREASRQLVRNNSRLSAACRNRRPDHRRRLVDVSAWHRRPLFPANG
jgi:ornithine decarboxylase/arginine decarboxylase